jgi:hypothetical protein
MPSVPLTIRLTSLPFCPVCTLPHSPGPHYMPETLRPGSSFTVLSMHVFFWLECSHFLSWNLLILSEVSYTFDIVTTVAGLCCWHVRCTTAIMSDSLLEVLDFSMDTSWATYGLGTSDGWREQHVLVMSCGGMWQVYRYMYVGFLYTMSQPGFLFTCPAKKSSWLSSFVFTVNPLSGWMLKSWWNFYNSSLT